MATVDTLPKGPNTNEGRPRPNVGVNARPGAGPITPNQDGVAEATAAFNSALSGVPYANSAAFQTLVKNISSDPKRTLINASNATGFADQIKTWANTFGNYFKNLTGQDPTSDEYNMFFDQVVNTQRPWENRGAFEDATRLLADTQSFVNANLSSQVNQAAQDKATKQAQDATAPGSAFDQWQQAYTSSINDVEKSLQDYQSKLFEKLRPSLITSLQSQGLLNSGALNEAFAGAAEDLGNASASSVAGMRQQAATDIANKKYSIMSAPTNFALNNTFSTPTNLSSAGTSALNGAFNADIQQQLMQQQFQNQQNLLNQQYAQQPSLLSSYGGAILGGVAGAATKHFLPS